MISVFSLYVFFFFGIFGDLDWGGVMAWVVFYFVVGDTVGGVFFYFWERGAVYIGWCVLDGVSVSCCSSSAYLSFWCVWWLGGFGNAVGLWWCSVLISILIFRNDIVRD